MASDQAPKILTRGWTTREGWRDTRLGMWAWLVQRAAAVALLGVVALHLANPFRRGVQAALLALVLLHALLGVRALLLDLGVPLGWHRALFWLALGLAAALFVLREQGDDTMRRPSLLPASRFPAWCGRRGARVASGARHCSILVVHSTPSKEEIV
jgi:succinate dehydrogenase hydrophobic anchor subunit